MQGPCYSVHLSLSPHLSVLVELAVQGLPVGQDLAVVPLHGLEVGGGVLELLLQHLNNIHPDTVFTSSEKSFQIINLDLIIA